MESLINKFSPFIIPPLLSLAVGLTLSVVSVVRGKFKTENVLFSLLCLWWALLAPAFISHFIFWGETDRILGIERIIHFFYVYLPLINLLYFHYTFKVRNRPLLAVFLSVSLVISIFTQTDYYFYGLHEYDWGYIAKGGPAFQAFGAYSFLSIIYFIYFLVKQLKISGNQVERLKLKYILLSFIISAFLSLMNIPAINGIDFYPFGNLIFIPLAFMAYGVLKYRLMEVRSILHVTLIWGITSSLIIIPNMAIYLLIQPYFSLFTQMTLFAVLLLWFLINHLYLRKNQPRIDQLFNRRKFDLRKKEADFIEAISFLKGLEDLIMEFSEILKTSLSMKSAEIFIRKGRPGSYRSMDGLEFAMDPDITEWFMGANHLADRSMVETNPYYAQVADRLLPMFGAFGCCYIVPLIQNDEMLGFVILPEKLNLRQLTQDEVRFINNVRSAFSIALSNSIMYEDLTDIKERLEIMVMDRTEELEKANTRLSDANKLLETAHRVAEMDMRIASNVQASLFPKTPPASDAWDVAFEFRPMSGVSGDLYDFYMKDGLLGGVSLFDVSGHGIASGLITMIARSVSHRCFTRMEDRPLKEVMGKINRSLIGEIGNLDNYLTGVLLRLSGGEIEYVNAGHPDMLRRTAGGGVQRAGGNAGENKGYFLGFGEMDRPYGSFEFKMEKGDSLLLYTDCLTESVNAAGREYGESGVISSFERAGDGTAREALDRILRDFHGFTEGRPPGDDLTVIIIKKN
ncbi:MAG: SpoIIE family protein phosphatase [Spirochaetes bacterium]|jgi:serine phosphatase RsbU (regulator of sigma subunit)|nr:SpoIIE family protein phosphatase [Spirochaetota bacterium]